MRETGRAREPEDEAFDDRRSGVIAILRAQGEPDRAIGPSDAKTSAVCRRQGTGCATRFGTAKLCYTDTSDVTRLRVPGAETAKSTLSDDAMADASAPQELHAMTWGGLRCTTSSARTGR